MEDKTEKLNTKKRKFNEDKLDSSFYCPLCGDKVQYMLAYPHLKECIYYFELAFDITPKPLSVTSYPDTHIFNPPPSCPSSFNIESSVPSFTNTQASVILSSNPPSRSREKIVRDVKCALPECKLTKQTPIFIKLNDRVIKLCAFSHIKSNITLETLNIKYPADYISETFYCEKCGEEVNWLIKLRESATDPKFEKVKRYEYINQLIFFNIEIL